MPRRQQQRLDRHVERAVEANGAGNLTNPEAHRLGEVAISRIDLTNAAHQESVGPHPGPKRAIGEDRQLRGGVEAVEVGAGIGFSEAKALRFGNRLGEREIALLEARHHEVTGRVDDAPEAVELVDAVAQVPDNRDRGRCGGFAVERRFRAMRQAPRASTPATPCSR